MKKITFIQGDILQANVDVVVNPVNCVGAMGKGLALEFKLKYPDMFKSYRQYCREGKLKRGTLHCYRVPEFIIVNLPTKIHFKYNSRPELIARGLQTLSGRLNKSKSIRTIAFPLLGSGEGRLDFKTDIYPLLKKFADSVDLEVYVYYLGH